MSLTSAVRDFAVFARLFRKNIKHPSKALKILHDMRQYNRLNTRDEFHASTEEGKFSPYLNDWKNNAGDVNYYFWQDLWASRKIYQLRPQQHFDIGSSVNGFISHVLTFMPVTMIDIRPLPFKMDGLKFIQADATNLEGFD